MSSNQDSYTEVSPGTFGTQEMEKVNCPQHFVFCENGVCKIDISYNDDNRFDLYRTYLRGLFEECLSKSVLAIQNSSERLETLQSFTKDSNMEMLNMFNNTSGYRFESLTREQDTDVSNPTSVVNPTSLEEHPKENDTREDMEPLRELVEVYEVNNTFMESIKLFAQSQNNFSEVLLKYSKNIESENDSGHHHAESESDSENESNSESDSETDSETENEQDSESEYTDDEVTEEPRGILSVVRYFAESQRNFSTSLYNFMSSGTFYSR